MIQSSLDAAVIATVAYFDIFAFAPTPREIHRFLMGRRASRAELEHALDTNPVLRRTLHSRDGFWFLAGKDHLVPRRNRFVRHSQGLWTEARRIARILEASGLARAGLVTGSLACDNADEHADIDFLFVYPAARAWTSFAIMRLLTHAPVAGLAQACPNYALPDDRLEIRPQNLFTAIELAKAVPMFGFDVYRELVRANQWVTRYLPNALPLLEAHPAPTPRRHDVRMVEQLTRTRWFEKLEARERRRKFKTDARDVGVDMEARVKSGSVDRHSPTRSFHTLSELAYRMRWLNLESHPVYAEIAEVTGGLEDQMTRWPNETDAAEPGSDDPLPRAGTGGR